MRTHGNITAATITPPNRTRSATASSNNSNGTNPTPSSDPKPPARLKLDARLESIRDVIESQPTAIQTTLSDTAVAMLLSTKTLRDKRAGFVNLTMNKDLIPKSCNIQAKLAFPHEMKDDPKTIENVQKWDDLVKQTREALKSKIIEQGERTIEFLEEKRQRLFNERLLVISEGYVTWFRELEGSDITTPLSNHAYGAACVYCQYNTLDSRNTLFTYLCADQDDLLKTFKKSYLTTATGTPLFSNLQLATLTHLLPALDLPQSPQRIDPNQPVTQEQDDAANAAAAAATPPPIPKELEHVMWQVKDRLYDLIKALFLDLVLTVETSQRELRANAKLEAALKKKKTLDLAKILEEDLAGQDVIAPANMQDLVNQLVDKRIDHKGQQEKKDLLKSALREARKKSLGGAKAAKTPPSKQRHGGPPNGNSKRTIAGTPRPSPKRAKKQNTQHPERDYRTLERQRQLPNNPYHNSNRRPPNATTPRRPSPSGRGSSPGRGRGRGQARGGYSNGRGRGRGRF
jgi:hypothetical protein